MTPKEFLKVQARQRETIELCDQVIYEARIKADKCPLPKRLRPAIPSDLVKGAILWYLRDTVDEGSPLWLVVEEVLNPNSEFKAYEADDGCRYGLEGAFVEIE